MFHFFDQQLVHPFQPQPIRFHKRLKLPILQIDAVAQNVKIDSEVLGVQLNPGQTPNSGSPRLLKTLPASRQLVMIRDGNQADLPDSGLFNDFIHGHRSVGIPRMNMQISVHRYSSLSAVHLLKIMVLPDVLFCLMADVLILSLSTKTDRPDSLKRKKQPESFPELYFYFIFSRGAESARPSPSHSHNPRNRTADRDKPALFSIHDESSRAHGRWKNEPLRPESAQCF